MNKAIKILQGIKPNESNYKKKITLLSEIINEPTVGHICPDSLVKWANKVGLKTELNCEYKTSWWSVSGK